jgi:hypothetical protein
MRILGIAGRKKSGKNTLGNFLHGYQMRANDLITDFELDDDGKLYIHYTENDKPIKGLLDTERTDAAFALWATTGIWPYVKGYSFAANLKEICLKLFDVPREALYGTDDQKNQIVPHLLWENMPGITTESTPQDLTPEEIASKLNKYYEKVLSGVIYHKPGPMTGREFMQYLGTENFRRMYAPVWTKSLMDQIKDEGSALSVITDVRFDNEAEAILAEGGKIIQLTRGLSDTHTSEKGLSPGLATDVLDNANLDLVDTCHGLLRIIESYGWQGE